MKHCKKIRSNISVAKIFLFGLAFFLLSFSFTLLYFKYFYQKSYYHLKSILYPTNSLQRLSQSAPLLKDFDNVAIPDRNTIPANKNILIPYSVSSATIKSQSKIRLYDISLTSQISSPVLILANHNDIITIRFNTDGYDYLISVPQFGLKKKIPANQSDSVQFQAVVSGVYKFQYISDKSVNNGFLIIRTASPIQSLTSSFLANTILIEGK